MPARIQAVIRAKGAHIHIINSHVFINALFSAINDKKINICNKFNVFALRNNPHFSRDCHFVAVATLKFVLSTSVYWCQC